MKKILISIILILAFVSNAISATFTSRDIKQPSETKLFISGNHQTPDFEDLSANKNQFTKYGDVKTVNEKSTTNPKYFPVGQDKGIYFDGIDDKCYCTDNVDFEIGSDNFTVDLWFNTNSLVDAGAYRYIIGKYASSGNQREYLLTLDENEKIQLLYSTNGTSYATMMSLSSVSLNKWNHIAFVKHSTDILLFINGILQETDTGVSSIFGGTASFQIGAVEGVTSSSVTSGFLQNIRISKGIARWTSNFTPPALNSTYPTDSYTKLYIKGHDKAVNTTAMTDDSGTSKTITTVGDTKIGYSRGTASYFDGTGDYLSLPRIDSGDYTKTTCVELWYYPLTLPTQADIISSFGAANGTALLCSAGNTLGFTKWSDSSNFYNCTSNPSGNPLSLNKWHHIVGIWEAGTTTNGNIIFYINGTKYTTTKKSAGTSSRSQSTAQIGYCTSGTPNAVNGYISGLKYSEPILSPYSDSSITPPETEPTPDAYTKLLMRNNVLNIRDISATPKTITVVGQTINRNFAKVGKNSIYLDGNNDKLCHFDIEDFEFGAGDFTFDMWFNTSTLVVAGTNDYIAGKWQTTGNQRGYGFLLDENQKINFWYSTNGTAITTMLSINAISINTWYHIAAVKSGTNIYLFVNGILQETDTGISSIFDGNASIQFGGWEGISTDCMNGYLSDIRITKGKALWTSNFTPPRRSGAF